jgi:uncharacterized RDD family membrane protein YckC
MTEQPPFDSDPDASRPAADYPPPPFGYLPPEGYLPLPDGGAYPPYGYPPPPPIGFVAIPGLGTVPVATFSQRLLARLIDWLIYGVLYVIFLVVAFALASSIVHTVTDADGHARSAPSGLGAPGFFLAFGIAMASGLLYEWLMLARKGATLGKLALGIKVVDQVSGQTPGYRAAFVRPLVPFAAAMCCSFLGPVVYLSMLFDRSGRMQGWHDKAAGDLVIKVR